MLSPGENVLNILKWNENKIIKLRVEISKCEQGLSNSAFDGIAELDAAGNLYFFSSSPISDKECCLNGEEISVMAPATKANSAKRSDVQVPVSPKKNVTAYIHFMKSVREIIKSKNSNLGFADIGTLIGKLYRELSAGDRRHWDAVAQSDKKRYEHELAKYYNAKGCSLEMKKSSQVQDSFMTKPSQKYTDGKGKEAKGTRYRNSEGTLKNGQESGSSKKDNSITKKRKRRGNKEQTSNSEPNQSAVTDVHVFSDETKENCLCYSANRIEITMENLEK
jgi:hypothetical protein